MQVNKANWDEDAVQLQHGTFLDWDSMTNTLPADVRILHESLKTHSVLWRESKNYYLRARLALARWPGRKDTEGEPFPARFSKNPAPEPKFG
jgi:hypothetical protein